MNSNAFPLYNTHFESPSLFQWIRHLQMCTNDWQQTPWRHQGASVIGSNYWSARIQNSRCADWWKIAWPWSTMYLGTMCAIDSKAFGQLFGYAVQVSIAHAWPAWERVPEVWDHWDYAMNSAIAPLFCLTCRCTYENSYRIYLGSDYEHITSTKVRPGYKWGPYY